MLSKHFTFGILDDPDRAGTLSVALGNLDAFVLTGEYLGEEISGVPYGSPELICRGFHLNLHINLRSHLLYNVI